jgi:hypothetical protein
MEYLLLFLVGVLLGIFMGKAESRLEIRDRENGSVRNPFSRVE